MGTSRSPIEFTDTLNQRCGNRVQLTNLNGAPAGNQVVVNIAPVVGTNADVNAPAANTAAVVTYGGIAGLRNVITGVAWSYYGGVPTGGNLTITDSGATIFNIDIAEEGPGFFEFPVPKSTAVFGILVITLAAGGAGITGKLSILNHWTE
jgi:hypothetical protein